MLNPHKQEDLESAKISLRIDYSDDDQLIKSCMVAAIGYLKGAIGKDKPSFYLQDDDELTEKLNMALLMLTDHYFQLRTVEVEGSGREPHFGITSIILQLKGDYLLYQEVVPDA